MLAQRIAAGFQSCDLSTVIRWMRAEFEMQQTLKMLVPWQTDAANAVMKLGGAGKVSGLDMVESLSLLPKARNRPWQSLDVCNQSTS